MDNRFALMNKTNTDQEYLADFYGTALNYRRKKEC
jgi:hypothetical protein